MRLVPPSYRQNHGHAVVVEYASERPIRTRNKLHYRIAHWPVWVFAFFIAPGPVTFTLFAEGVNTLVLGWLAVAIAGTAIAGLFGRLPGTEPTPYVLLYGEDTPNPVHRRICYTAAWAGLGTYAVLNLICIVDALAFGVWRSNAIYAGGYLPIAAMVWLLGAAGLLPRAKRSTAGEGYERRQFYGAVWSVTAAQVAQLVLWKTLPVTRMSDALKLVVFIGVLAGMAQLARRGWLPRTRPILPGTRAVAD